MTEKFRVKNAEQGNFLPGLQLGRPTWSPKLLPSLLCPGQVPTVGQLQEERQGKHCWESVGFSLIVSPPLSFPLPSSVSKADFSRQAQINVLVCRGAERPAEGAADVLVVEA